MFLERYVSKLKFVHDLFYEIYFIGKNSEIPAFSVSSFPGLVMGFQYSLECPRETPK